MLKVEELKDAIELGAVIARKLCGKGKIVYVCRCDDGYVFGVRDKGEDLPDYEPVLIWRCWEVDKRYIMVDILYTKSNLKSFERSE